MARFISVLILCIALLGCSSGSEKASDCKTCKDFKTQADAKAYAKSNPKCKKRLDSDKDGKFCEDLPKE